MKRFVKAVAMASTAIMILATAACAPEVGSEEWCSQMKEKPKGDWTANEAADFAKHCIVK